MLHAVFVLSLLCYSGLVTSQRPPDAGQTGSVVPVDTAGGQTGLDQAGSQTGFDQTGGQTSVDQTVLDPMGGQGGVDPFGGQTGFDPMGGQTGFDPVGGQTGFDPLGQTGFDQTGFGAGGQGGMPGDQSGGFGGVIPTTTPPFGDMFVPSQSPIVGGTVLGGVNPVQAIEPIHNEIAMFATSELGFEYTFNRIVDVHVQTVQGTLYHIKMNVTKTSSRGGMTDWVCDVQVHDIPWNSERRLREFHCAENASPVV